MSMLKQLKDGSARLSGKALEKLFEDPRRAERIAQAAGAVQRGKQRLESAQGQVLHAMGFASQDDYAALRKRISAARRQAKHVLEQLEKLSGR